MIDDMIAWLTIQLDDDERTTRACIGSMRDSLKLQLGMSLWEARDLDHAKGMPSVWSHSYIVASDLAEADAAHIALWDPRRALAEVAAKRKRIDHYLKIRDLAEPNKHPAQEYVLAKGAAAASLRIDAEVYAARPGWRDEWRP